MVAKSVYGKEISVQAIRLSDTERHFEKKGVVPHQIENGVVTND